MGLTKKALTALVLIVLVLISSILLAKEVKITRRVMTEQEFNKFKEYVGVYEEGRNYNIIIDGHGTGLKPPTEEQWEKIRKRAIVVDKMEFFKDGAPPSHDNSATNWLPPIGNQDGEGSCVSWACGYYTKTFQEAQEHNWDLSGCVWEGGYYGHPSVAYQGKIFSPDFIYHQVNNGEDGGSYYSDNMNLLERIGCCTWDKMPYDPTDSTTWPDEDAWRQAPWYRSQTGYGYMWIQTDAALENLKQMLADTNLAIISINAYYYDDMTANDLWTLDNYNPSGTNHANTIVGYNDNYGPYTEAGNPNTYGAFKVANSWGVGGWEYVADGFYYISYECMKQRVEYVFFYENLVNYESEMIAVFQLSHNRRGECEATFGIGDISSPASTKRFDDYIYNGGGHPFPSNKMVMDITEFVPYMSGPPDNFFLGIYDGSSATTGTIDFFSIEIYDDYGSGVPIETYVSTNPPVNTVNFSTVYAQVTSGVPSLTVTSPNGGEDWEVGSSQTIGWTSTGSIPDVKLEYSTNGGSDWTTIVSTTPNDGSHPWTVPATPSTNCKVKVSDASDGDPWDISDNPFTITQPTITLISPNGGEDWEVGSSQTISWTSIGSISDVKLEYSTNGGSDWTTIASSTPNDGSYSWTVPATPSTNCLVKVSDALDGDPWDVSDNPFTITQPTITVTSPNGGKDWEVGSSQTITWTPTGSIPNVKLEYSTNGGSDWTTIISSTPNDGSHPWTVPSTPSTNCLVKVSDALDGDPWDVSNTPFTLSDRTPPSQVTNLEATSTDTSIILKWSPATDNIGVHHYLIYRDTTSGLTPNSSDSLTTSIDTLYIDLEAEAGVTYYYRVSAVDGAGNEGEYSNEAQATIPTGIKAERFLKYLKSFLLMQNYPDPFNQVTEIRYTLPKGAQVKLEVYNLLGQRIATLVDERQASGCRSVKWDASSFTSGVYIYRLSAGTYTQARKMVLLK